jgi:sugar phosphate isomerase/epimerase
MALGKGSLDLDRIIRTLCSHDFSGPVVLEVLRGDGLSSIERLKQLIQETGGLP